LEPFFCTGPSINKQKGPAKGPFIIHLVGSDGPGTPRPFQGHPFEGSLSSAKAHLVTRKSHFFVDVYAVIDFFAIAAVSFSFGISSSLYQSPIWIKVSLVLRMNSVTLSPRSGDQKIFGSLPCPKRVSQIVWLSASPKVAHGTGSKDSDNSIIVGGADYQSSLVVLPHPKQVHRSSHPVINGLSHTNIFSGMNSTSSRIT
jgi:hypothetical protein